MANKSIRIQTTAGGTDKYVTLKLENDVDFYEVLSLKISQKDVYGSFNANYGVIVGRVIANGGVGIPNAKISVFIPISDDDKTNADIFAIYPYASPRDKDQNGVRYNLLPRVAVNNPFIIEGDYAPKVPIGTFPTKEEITTNDSFLEVYEKYYKFTTVSNTSGDYMFFGVPIGIQTVHMSVDITDIGKYSMTPGTMINNLGYSKVLFTNNGTAVKFSTDLETLPNVELQEIAVNVRPFWGDNSNFEIGITRQDFKIRALLITTFTVFGSAFTDAQSATWGRGKSSIKQLYAMYDSPSEIFNRSITTKRNGLISEKLFYLPNTITTSNINTGNFDTKNDYKILDKSQYTRYVDNGQFIYIIPCNRNKVITNDEGNEEIVDNNDPRGVFTEFNGFMLLDYSDKKDLPIDRVSEYDGKTPDPDRFRFKIPQYPPQYRANPDASANPNIVLTPEFSVPLRPPTDDIDNEKWRKQNFKFVGGNFYSVSKFHGTKFSNDNSDENAAFNNEKRLAYSSGLITTNELNGNVTHQLTSNGTNIDGGSIPVFGVEWLNFSLYFPQYSRYNTTLGDNDAGRTRLLNEDNRNTFQSNDNNQLIAATEINTKHIARADLNATDFIQVPKEDILNIIDRTLDGSSKQGFKSTDSPYNSIQLIGTDYKGIGSTKYFYKGLSSTSAIVVNGNADVFLYLRELNLV